MIFYYIWNEIKTKKFPELLTLKNLKKQIRGKCENLTR